MGQVLCLSAGGSPRPAHRTSSKPNYDWLVMATTNDVLAEVADCLYSAALLTRALNRLVENGSVARIDTRVMFARNTAIVTKAVLQGMVESKLDEDAMFAIRNLFEAIEAGKTRIERFRTSKGRDAASDWKEICELALHWRRVCALGVFVQLCLKHSLRADPCPQDRFDRLISLLTDAGQGRSTPMCRLAGTFLRN